MGLDLRPGRLTGAPVDSRRRRLQLAAAWRAGIIIAISATSLIASATRARGGARRGVVSRLCWTLGWSLAVAEKGSQVVGILRGHCGRSLGARMLNSAIDPRACTRSVVAAISDLEGVKRDFAGRTYGRGAQRRPHACRPKPGCLGFLSLILPM